MITFGLTGFSGTGKSTLSKQMKEKIPNSRYVDGDIYMYGTLTQYRKLTEEMWGESIYKSNGDLSFTCVTTGGEKGREFMKIVSPWISKQIEEEIERAKNDGIDCLIIDWTALPSLEVWKYIDVKVHIISDEVKRHEMLAARKIRGCSPEFAKKRDEFFSYAYENMGKSVLECKNDFTEESNIKNLTMLLYFYERLKGMKSYERSRKDDFRGDR